MMSDAYLPAGLPIPVAEHDGLSAPFWQGLREGLLRVQHNPRTGVYQFPAQWICHDTQTFDVEQMLKGDRSKDMALLPGDDIFVPATDPNRRRMGVMEYVGIIGSLASVLFLLRSVR